MKKISILLTLFFIFFFSLSIFAQKNIYLQGDLKDTQIRSTQDTILFSIKEGKSAKDATIHSYSPDSTYNYGIDSAGFIGCDTLFTTPDSAGVSRVLIKSDSITNYLPDNAIITSVILTVYRDTIDTSYGSGIADLHEITKSWSEGDSNGAVDTVSWYERLV